MLRISLSASASSVLLVASAGPGVLSSSTKEPMVVSSSSPTGVSSDSVSAAYLFSGCTSLKTVPEDMFRHFEGTTIISEMFLYLD